MSDSKKTRVCVIGAGPSGMSALFYFANLKSKQSVEVVCFEKQSTWGGLWNFSWRTGTDEYGETCHNGMYKHLWSNNPKECLEYPDYTFEEHNGKVIPSFVPRPVIRDYLEGRWNRKSKEDLSKYIKFNTVVRHVEYIDADDKFTVDVTNLKTNTSSKEMFDYVIVSVGIFNVPNVPDFPGIEKFEGRILHSHNFRNASEFKGQRLLVIGSSYSAEDIALQCMKFGASTAICSWRTKPMGFKWPKGIEERPLVQEFKGKTAYFKDGSSAEIDAVIMGTGYLYSFPFMEERLLLKSRVSFFPENLYKGVLWLRGGNNKLFYVGVQDQYFSFTMFDVQAMWICKFIYGQLLDEPKSSKEMQDNADTWVNKLTQTRCADDLLDFQTEYMADIIAASCYNPDALKTGELFHAWRVTRDDDILTYRDHCYNSNYTGKKSAKHGTTWWTSFDDSIEAVCKVKKQ